ncbi:MAG: S1-like domain-containing RNA-binding protein [Lachnospiraceae bacterium]|nr:S1-like domain-containing RNA-binding protein [Lachnospiraceae bacterium]
MITLGKKQTLRAVKQTDFGLYFAEENDPENRILLPKKEIPESIYVGDDLEVFVYLDSEDRPIATTTEPLLSMGEVALLRVVSVSKIGAFLSWGLPKDLFLPFKEQAYKVKEGDEVLVSLYKDKSSRLCATMNVYHNLRTDSPYKEGDDVFGRLYEESPTYGLFVAVDDKYSALIPRKEVVGEYKMGNMVYGRVIKVREDGKLTLAVRDKSYVQMIPDGETILELLESYGGVLPFSEKADPSVIQRETGMSKAQFKRAIGHLYKERKITITDGVIRKA